MKIDKSTFYSYREEYEKFVLSGKDSFGKLSWIANRYCFFIKEYTDQVNDELRIVEPSFVDDIYKLQYKIEKDIQFCYWNCVVTASNKKHVFAMLSLEQLKVFPDPNFEVLIQESLQTLSKNKFTQEIRAFINKEMYVYETLPLVGSGSGIQLIDKNSFLLKIDNYIDDIYSNKCEENNLDSFLYKALGEFFNNPLLDHILSEEEVKYFFYVMIGTLDYDQHDERAIIIRQLMKDETSKILLLDFLKYIYGSVEDYKSMLRLTKKDTDGRIALLIDEKERSVRRYSRDERPRMSKIACPIEELESFNEYKRDLTFNVNIAFSQEINSKR